MPAACARFFGGGGPFGGFGGFGFGGGEEEEQIPKGADVYVELEVTLRDLYLGNTFRVGISLTSAALASKQMHTLPHAHSEAVWHTGPWLPGSSLQPSAALKSARQRRLQGSTGPSLSLSQSMRATLACTQ